VNELSWIVEREQGRAVVAPVGTVTVGTSAGFEDALLALAAETDVVLDLGEVTFVDSSGLSVLIAAYKAGRKHRHTVVLDPVPPFLERVLEVTGLGTLLLAPHRVR
jgi:anti-sigma B factor antagonist